MEYSRQEVGKLLKAVGFEANLPRLIINIHYYNTACMNNFY